MSLEAFLDARPALNFIAYISYCAVAWSISLYLYEKATPYREWDMVLSGNKAAAWSIGGVGIGLAMPLASLALHAEGWAQLFLWTSISLAAQLGLWFVLAKTAMRELKVKMEAGVESVGMLLGASAISFGLMIAASVT